MIVFDVPGWAWLLMAAVALGVGFWNGIQQHGHTSITDGGTLNLPISTFTITGRRIPFGDNSGNLTSNAALTFDGTALAFPGNLAFPATPAPSSNATTLDDYEEGSWTPSIEFGGGTTGLNLNQQSGRYVKIGQMVWLQFEFNIVAKGTDVGAVKITGLPFSILAGGTLGGAIEGGGTGGTRMFLYTGNDSGLSKCTVYKGAGSPGTVTTDADFSASFIVGQLCYRAT